MDIKLYGELASRTAKDMGTERLNLGHFAFGAFTEAGELGTMTKAHIFYGKDFDRQNAVEELGDIAWFIINTLRVLGEDYTVLMEGSVEGQTVVFAVDEMQKIQAASATLPTSMKEGFFNLSWALGGGTGRVLQMLDPFATGFSTFILDSERAMIVQQLVINFQLVSISAHILRIPMSSVLLQNIQKLAKRYGDKYTDHAALLRADKKED